MLHGIFQIHRPSGFGKDLKGFYHKWAWQSSWSCDLDYLYKFTVSRPINAPHEVKLYLAMWCQIRFLNVMFIYV